MSRYTCRTPLPNDIDSIIYVNRQCEEIAQHSYYLFWLCVTIYSKNSLVLFDDDDNIAGYILSLPSNSEKAEFLLQIAVLPEARRNGTGIFLLSQHWELMKKNRIRIVQTSIHSSCKRGLALMKLARGRGHRYIEIPWPFTTGVNLTYALEEILYEAKVY